MAVEKFKAWAGGVFTADRDYDRWSSRDKYDAFWGFFFDEDYGWVRSVYGDIPVEQLYRNHHSIEHVVPKSRLSQLLGEKGARQQVVYGARTNPLNFLAAERDLNSLRGNEGFDTEDDPITLKPRIPLNPNAVGSTGFDGEREWVVPTRTRGDVARCVLYMMLVYGLDTLYEEDLGKLRRWAMIDPPQPWEIAYNAWVHARLAIQNPLVSGLKLEDFATGQPSLEQAMAWLRDDDLFQSVLAPVDDLTIIAPPRTAGGLARGYGVLVGRYTSSTRDMEGAYHLMARLDTDQGSYQVAVNVQSRHSDSVDPQQGYHGNELLVFIDEDYKHPITQRLVGLDVGYNALEKKPDGKALDYIRGNLFDPEAMDLIPASTPGPSNDLFERLEAILEHAGRAGATLYAFGQPFKDGRGLHSVHMNQGSILTPYDGEDGVYQDGALFVRFEGHNGKDRWVAIFLAFQSQCWHTDDTSGEANTDERCSRFATGDPDRARGGVAVGDRLRIISALVNPLESPEQGHETVTLMNYSMDEIDLGGWELRDRSKRKARLSGTIGAMSTRTFTLLGAGDEAMRLSNSGGIISLIDNSGLKVHGVSYTREEVREGGEQVIFTG